MQCNPPRVWLLSELELRLKNQRVACHETKPLTPEFKVLGQPVTFGVRSMTQNRPECDLADNFVSEQARAAILRPERSLRSYEYYAMSFGPLQTVLGVKIQNIIIHKNSHFLLFCFSTPIFRHMNDKRMPNSKFNAAKIQCQRPNSKSAHLVTPLRHLSSSIEL